MGGKCHVEGCVNDPSKKQPGKRVYYYGLSVIEKRNPNGFQAFLDAANLRPLWNVLDYRLICSEHYTDNDFMPGELSRVAHSTAQLSNPPRAPRLRADALPTLNIVRPLSPQNIEHPSTRSAGTSGIIKKRGRPRKTNVSEYGTPGKQTPEKVPPAEYESYVDITATLAPPDYTTWRPTAEDLEHIEDDDEWEDEVDDEEEKHVIAKSGLNAADAMDNFYSRCLLCTCRPDVTPHLHIYSDAGKQLQLADKIKYLNIQIEAELPQNVCHSCMEKLEVTHELVTSSQQARIMLLQMKQQSEEEIPMDDCSAEDFDQSHSADLQCTAEGTVEQPAEAALISKIDIEEHAIKLEPGEDQLDCLPLNADTEPLHATILAECQVPVLKLLECHLCCFYTNSKTQLATHIQDHLQAPNTSDGSRRHPANKSREFKYQKCAQCGSTYVQPEMLAWHIENCHGTDAIVKVVKTSTKPPSFQCLFCETACKQLKLMIRHLCSQHGISNLPFQCNACNRQFVTRHDLGRHKCFFKNKKQSFSTAPSHDNAIFSNSPMKNIEVVKQWGIKCKICHHVFKSEDHVKSHKSKVHAVKRGCHKCLHCNETFTSFSPLKFHCKSKHPGMHILQCNICDAEFSSCSGYRWHKNRVHGTHLFTCNICSAKFSRHNSLTVRNHETNMHSVSEYTFL